MTLVSRFIFPFKNEIKNKLSGTLELKEISIIIPVKDNQKGIENYLDRFFACHSPGQFPKEIIVIDNNSHPEIEIPQRHKEIGLVKLEKCKRLGPGAARNYGVEISNGKWLLFNDSDCMPTESLLSGYLKTHSKAVAYAGNIMPLSKSMLSKYYGSQEILLPPKIYNLDREFVPQYLITANALVWREAFVEVGGFNEKIQIAGGEDIDLGLRLSQIGGLSYAFDSVALHNFDDGLIGFCKRFNRYGYGNRIIQELYETNMKPLPFTPNKKTYFNILASKIQYICLLFGYMRANEEIKRSFSILRPKRVSPLL